MSVGFSEVIRAWLICFHSIVVLHLELNFLVVGRGDLAHTNLAPGISALLPPLFVGLIGDIILEAETLGLLVLTILKLDKLIEG